MKTLIRNLFPPAGGRADELGSGAWSHLAAVQVLVFAAVCGYCTLSQRYLYGDGANFFLALLKRRQTAHWYPARQFAHALTQIPAVFLLRDVHCRDVDLVGLTYGATLYLLPLGGLLVTLWAARRVPGHYWAFPILSHAIMFLTTSFYIISEIHVAVSLFWCLLYLLMFSDRLTVVRSVLLVVLAVLAARTYEIYLFLSWPLILVAWRRGRMAWAGNKRAEAVICGVCIVLFLAGAGIALRSTLFPRDQGQRSLFAVSLLLHLVYPPVWYSLVSIGGALVCVVSPAWRRGLRFLRLAVAGCGFVVAIQAIAGIIVPPLQLVARVQGLYVPLILGGLLALDWPEMRMTRALSTERQASLWRWTAWLCLVAAVFQTGATAHWNRYRSVVVHELAQHRGLVAYEQSSVAGPVLEKLLERDYRAVWLGELEEHPSLVARRLKLSQFHMGLGWSMPSLSIALGALNLGSVATVIEAPASSRWQPFDPHKPNALYYLQEYGIQVDLDHPDMPD